MTAGQATATVTRTWTGTVRLRNAREHRALEHLWWWANTVRNALPDYAQSSSGPFSVEKSDPLGLKATAEPVRNRNQTPGGTPDLRGTAAVFLQHELRT